MSTDIPRIGWWVCNLHDHTGPQARKDPILGLMLCCLKLLSNFIFELVFYKWSRWGNRACAGTWISAHRVPPAANHHLPQTPIPQPSRALGLPTGLPDKYKTHKFKFQINKEYILNLSTVGPPYLQLPHLQIQPTANWKYFLKNPESSKKQNLNLLAAIYIAFTLY